MKTQTKVGIFVVLGLFALFVLSTQVQISSYFQEKGYTLYLDIKNAGSLSENAKVKSNGVDIGYIKSIYLHKGKARLELFIHKKYKITHDATALIAQQSFLGGKYINLVNSTSDYFLKDKDEIKTYKTFAEIYETSQKIFEISDSASVLLEAINKHFDEEGVKELKQTITSFNQMAKSISQTSLEIQNLSKLLNKDLPKLAQNLNQTITSFKHLADNTNQDLPKILNNLEQFSNKLNSTIDNTSDDLNQTIAKAKILFDNSNSVVTDVQDLLSAVNKSELKVSLKAQMPLDNSYGKSALSAAYRPNPSNYYMLDLVNSVIINKKDENNTVILPKKHEKSEMLFSAQLGKRYDNLLLRAGLIESTGGAGIDYFLAQDKIKASFEIFDFNAVNDIRGDKPHARFSLMFSPFRYINVFGGADNFLNPRSNNYFFGAGLEFVDDDLKNIVLGSGALSKVK